MRLKDVADQLGLAPSTVSRALNHPEMVAAETRIRVLEAVQKARYQPDRIARSLRIRQTSTIGLIVSDILNPFHAELARTVEQAARQRGYTVIFGNSNEEEEQERDYLETFVSSRVSGIILAPSGNSSETLRRMVDQGIVVVQVDRLTPGLEADAVLLDNSRGASLAVTHLIDLGHRRIGMIAGPQHLTTGKERLEGYKSTLLAAGLPYNPDLVYVGNFRESGGYEGTRALLSLPDPPTAILTANSEMAAGAVRALREANLVIGKDISLVTFDDTRWAQYMLPPLTVVAQPVEEIGRTAVDVLFRRLERRTSRSTIYTLQPYLIERASTGRPPR